METKKEKFSEKVNYYSTSQKDTDSKNTVNESKLRQFRKETINRKNNVTNENSYIATIAAENSSNKNLKVVTIRSGRVVQRPKFYQAV